MPKSREGEEEEAGAFEMQHVLSFYFSRSSRRATERGRLLINKPAHVSCRDNVPFSKQPLYTVCMCLCIHVYVYVCAVHSCTVDIVGARLRCRESPHCSAVAQHHDDDCGNVYDKSHRFERHEGVVSDQIVECIKAHTQFRIPGDKSSRCGLAVSHRVLAM